MFERFSSFATNGQMELVHAILLESFHLKKYSTRGGKSAAELRLKAFKSSDLHLHPGHKDKDGEHHQYPLYAHESYKADAAARLELRESLHTYQQKFFDCTSGCTI